MCQTQPFTGQLAWTGKLRQGGAELGKEEQGSSLWSARMGLGLPHVWQGTRKARGFLHVRSGRSGAFLMSAKGT